MFASVCVPTHVAAREPHEPTAPSPPEARPHRRPVGLAPRRRPARGAGKPAAHCDPARVPSSRSAPRPGDVTHPSGLPAGDGTHACRGCAWGQPDDLGLRCAAAAPPDGSDAPWMPADTLACAHWEPPVACASCGACCREAFDAVPVEEGDPTPEHHPELVMGEPGAWREIRRVPSPTGCGTRCAALNGDGSVTSPFHCAIYAHRATACRELEPGSPNCHLARVRTNLSPPTHTSVAGPRSAH